jgi:hypothetical protein
MLDGPLCAQCGEYLHDGGVPGLPSYCTCCRPRRKKKKRKNRHQKKDS